MSQIIIDIGDAPDDGLGTPLRQAFSDINTMFSEVYGAGPAATNVRIANNTITTTVINSNLVLSPSGIGKIQVNNSVLPRVDDVYDLGSPIQRFNTLYLGTGGFDSVGNITANFYIGNGRFLTGVQSTASEIIFGNTFVTIPDAGANVYIVVSSTNVANITVSSADFLVPITTTGNVTANTFIGNVIGNITGNLSAPGSNGQIIYNAQGTASASPGFSFNVATNAVSIGGNLTVSGGANISDDIIAYGNIDLQQNLYVLGTAEIFGQLITDNGVDVTGNLIANNISSLNRLDAQTLAISSGASVTGNLAVAANISAAGMQSSGNVSASYFLGNGALLTGIDTTLIRNGNSNVKVVSANGNATVNIGGTSNVAVFYSAGMDVTGNLGMAGNIIPAANAIYDIGSPSQRFRDIYLSGNTIDINSATIEANATALILTNPLGGQYIVDGTGVSDNSRIQKGTSSVSIPTANGVVLISSNNAVIANINASGALISGNIDTLANVNAGNVVVSANILSGNANITGITTVNTLVITGNSSVTGNTNISGNLSVTGNITGNSLTTGSITANSTISATGNITANSLTTGSITANSTISATGNVTANSLTTGSITANSTISATGNVTAGNIDTTGTATAGSITVTGDALISGNLAVNGNVTYINVEDLNIEDPIIGLGRGANNTPLTINDGKDRGEQLWYYSGSEKSAFVGYDNSAGNLIAAVDVTVANDIVTINNLGNFVAGNVVGGNLISTGLISATGNIETTANINVGNIRFADNTVYTGNTIVTVPSNGALNTFQWKFSDSSIGNSTTTLQWNLLDTDLSQWYLATNNQTKIYTFDADAQTVGFANSGAGSGTVTFGATANGGAGGTNDIELTTVTGNAYVRTGSNSWQFSNTGNLSAPGNIAATAFLGRGLFNGISSIEIPTANSNIVVGVNGVGSTEFTQLGINTLTLAALANITAAGTITATGNLTAGNLNTSGQANVVGNVVGSNINAIGNVTGTGAVFSGNVTAANFIGNIQGNIDAGGSNTQIQFNDDDVLAGSAAFTFDKSSNLVTVSGNVNAGNVNSTAKIVATGNVEGGNITTVGRVDATGNVTGGNITTAGNVDGANITASSTVVATGNVTGGNITTAGRVDATGNVTGGNITTAGRITATGNIVSSANISAANLVASANVAATGNVSASYFIGNGALLSGIDTTLISSGNSNVKIVAANGNATINIAGTSNVAVFANTGAAITGTLSVSGNITGGNLSTSGSGGNITGANVVSANTFTAAGNVDSANVSASGTIVATGNVTGGNITTAGRVDAVSNVAGGNITTVGRVDATGNVAGGNITTVGRVDATGNVAGGNITTAGRVDATSNVAGGNITTAGRVDALGNVTGSNLVTAGTVSATGNIITAANVLATSNVAGGNITTTGRVDATGNVSGGNITTVGRVDATGNVSGGNITTTGNVDATGVVTAANLVATNSVVTNAISATDLTISASGNIQFSATGNRIDMGGADVHNVGYPQDATDAATKQYVDDAVSSGIHIHDPVQLETPTALPSATYAQGGTVYTVTDTVAGNTVVFSTAANLQPNDQLWFANSFEGIVGNTSYFVVSAPNTSAAILSTTYDGVPVSNITSNTGLTESVRVNSGIGATLTATANGALTVDSVAVSVGNRILVYNQSTQYENGVYTVTDPGNVSAPWILTRATDSDQYAPNSNDGMDSGSYYFVQQGATGAGESYVLTSPQLEFIIGYDAVEFTQFSASQVYSANAQAGIDLTGTVFSAKTDGETTAFDGGGNIKVKDSANLVTPNIGAATGNTLSTTGNITAPYFIGNLIGNISGNLSVLGPNTGVVFNDDSLANSSAGFTFDKATNAVSIVGNASAGNISTVGLITAAGNITGAAILASAAVISGNLEANYANITTSAGMDISGGNLRINELTGLGGELIAQGNVSGLNVNTGNISLTGNVLSNLWVDSNIAGGNAALSGNLEMTGGYLLLNELTGLGGELIAQGNVSALNVNTGNISLTGNVLSNLRVDGNIAATNAVYSGQLDVTGANIDIVDVAAVGGNLNAVGANISGNVTANYFLGNGACLTGVITSVANINNGTSNVEIAVPDGNVAVTVDSTANVAVFANTGIYVTGEVSASGNITAVEFIGNANASSLTSGIVPSAQLSGTYNINISGNAALANTVSDNSQPNITSVGTLTSLSVTGNIDTGNLNTSGTVLALANVTGSNLVTAGIVTATGNVTGGNITTTGRVDATGNVTGGNLITTGNVDATGNVLGGNLVTAGLITATGNIESSANVTASANVIGGNISTSGVITATGNIQSSANVAGANLIASANVVGGNIVTAGEVTATGNITTTGNVQGNFILGNGSFLTGIITSVSNISDGTSNIRIVSTNGNAAANIGGTNNVWVLASTGQYVTGVTSVSGNITGGNIETAGLITATGNVTGGNIVTTGTVDATANITGGNINTAGLITATGNIAGGNIASAGNIDATGNIAGGNISTTGSLLVSGNLTVNGNVTYVNVEELNVEDPIIGLGRGPNNDPLTSDDGKDRGEQLWYYSGSEKSAFIGYDNSNARLIAATNVTITNEVVAVGEFGNFQVGTLEAAAANVAGNIDAQGIVASGNISASYYFGNASQMTGIVTPTSVYTTINLQGNVTGIANANAILVASNSLGNLQVIAGNGIQMSGNGVAGNIVISVIGSTNDGTLWGSGGSAGLVTESTDLILDNGLVTDSVTSQYDLGLVSQPITEVTWGTSRIALAGINGNAVITVAGVANVVEVSTTDMIVKGNILPESNVTYDLGSSANRWNDIWLANSTIYLGEAEISAAGANLILPATVQIGSAVLDASSGNLALPENISAVTVEVSGNITAGNISTDNYTFANGAPFSSYSNSDVTTLLASFGSNSISTTGNITSGTISTAGNISAGNISTDNYTFANGAPFSSYSDSEVTTLLASFGSNSISTTGNVGAGYFVSSRSIGTNTELANTNYMATGPITINNGVTVTIGSGGVWSIV